MTMTKKLRELVAGDVVRLKVGGTAQITAVRRASWIRHVDGPVFDVQYTVISGPTKGETGYAVDAGDEEVNLA